MPKPTDLSTYSKNLPPFPQGNCLSKLHKYLDTWKEITKSDAVFYEE